MVFSIVVLVLVRGIGIVQHYQEEITVLGNIVAKVVQI